MKLYMDLDPITFHKIKEKVLDKTLTFMEAFKLYDYRSLYKHMWE